MQEEILEANPDADFRVYAIFFEIVTTDRGAKQSVDPKSLLDDPRVTMYWDDDRAAGRWFDEHVTHVGRRENERDRIEWDAYVVYDAGATWTERPPLHVSWGRPLIQERMRLSRDLEGSLARSRR